MHTSDEMARNISSRAFKNARPQANLRGRFIGGGRPRFMKGKPCRSIGKSFSKRRSKNAASLRGKR
jgi:hypothetical protein